MEIREAAVSCVEDLGVCILGKVYPSWRSLWGRTLCVLRKGLCVLWNCAVLEWNFATWVWLKLHWRFVLFNIVNIQNIWWHVAQFKWNLCSWFDGRHGGACMVGFDRLLSEINRCNDIIMVKLAKLILVKMTRFGILFSVYISYMFVRWYGC